MPIGEDIPMLIPISIVLTVFIVFLVALISSFAEQTDIVKLSQISLNVGDYITNSHPNLSLGMGRLNGTYLDTLWYPKSKCPDNCDDSKLSYLFNTSYNNIAVKIKTDTACWCWNKLHGEKQVTNEFPVLIINNSQTIPAKVVISVSQ